jgi:CBS domain containing-hemolysin-like protein
VILGLIVMVVVLLSNGMFGAAEFSLIASRRSELEQLAEDGDQRAWAAVRAVRELSVMLPAAQLAITVGSLILGAVGEPAVSQLFHGPLQTLGLSEAAAHHVSFAVALAIVVFLEMVVGEMIPKNIALADPVRVALLLGGVMRTFVRLFRPAVGVVSSLSRYGLRLLGIEARDELSEARTGDEIAEMLSVSHRAGVLEEVEHRLMTGALRFPARDVATVIVPRAEIVTVPAGASPATIEALMVSSGHSRIVVSGRDLDDVLGFVHAKDLLALDPARRSRPLPGALIRRMLVLPADQPLPDVLLAMRRARVHAGLVVASGHTVGLVTLEDVLAALVGDIGRETDSLPEGT